jgi:hypothetical protein
MIYQMLYFEKLTRSMMLKIIRGFLFLFCFLCSLIACAGDVVCPSMAAVKVVRSTKEYNDSEFVCEVSLKLPGKAWRAGSIIASNKNHDAKLDCRVSVIRKVLGSHIRRIKLKNIGPMMIAGDDSTLVICTDQNYHMAEVNRGLKIKMKVELLSFTRVLPAAIKTDKPKGE